MKQYYRNIKDHMEMEKDLHKLMARSYRFDTSRMATKKEVISAFTITAAMILAWIIGVLYSKIIMGVIFIILILWVIYQYYFISKSRKK
jgi:hypothetical protein